MSLGVESVSVDGHFFDDLGADSLVMAQFCARVRKRPDLPSVSMKDVYQHPTISSLAAALAPADAAPPPVESSAPAQSSRRRRSRWRPVEGATPVGTLQYVLCGALQFLIFLGYSYLAAFVTAQGFGVDLRGLGSDRHLPAVGAVRRRAVRRRVHPADPGQVGAHRSVEAAADPHLESGVRPFLDGQDAGPGEPAGHVRRVAAVLALSAGVGGEDRAGCRDLHPARAGVHRPADHGRRHGHPQGVVPSLLPGARGSDPDRRGHPRPGRVHRREDRAGHQHVDGRRGAARPHLHAAQRPGGTGRRAVARVSGATHRGGLPEGRAGAIAAPCAASATASSTLLEVFFIVMPLAEGGVYMLLAAVPSLDRACWIRT